MDIRHFQLSEAQSAALAARELKSTEALERRRLLAIRLYGTGESEATIRKVVQASGRTIRRWVKHYTDHGIEQLERVQTGGNHRRLSLAQRAEVVGLIQGETPHSLGLSGQAHWTVAEVRQLVEARFAIVYAEPASYRALLREAGLSYQRVAKVYRHRPSARVVDDWQADAEKK